MVGKLQLNPGTTVIKTISPSGRDLTGFYRSVTIT